MATPTAEQLARINEKALVPMKAEDAYVFPAKVIGTRRIAKYLMKISPNFLQKMAGQLKEGVALLVDHPWAKFIDSVAIPYGRTFDSRIVHENGEMELYADHYMVKGQTLNGISTNDLAAGIDSGTIFDTSAGFITTKHSCNVCGNNYFSSDCEHFRGRTYDGKECLAIAEDGYIMENSIVFDGGYEGAGIVKNNLSTNGDQREAKQMLEPLSPDAKSLSSDERVFYFYSNTSGVSAYVAKSQQNEGNHLSKGDETVNDAEKAAPLAAGALSGNLLGQIRAVLGVDADDKILSTLSAMSLQAKDGAAYKTALIEETCGAGVRALGEAFSVEAMKLSFGHLGVTELTKVRDTYEAQAKVVLGGGGRHTLGTDPQLPVGAPSNPQTPATLSAEEKQAAAREEARAALSRNGHNGIMKEAK